MAVDLALLKVYASGQCLPALRLYQWNPPAVSLGYFQRRRGPNPIACRRLGLDLVRRPTGGRAVLHKGDLTYAVIGGVRDNIPFSADGAYQAICRGLILGLQRLGIEADAYQGSTNTSSPTVCFMRPAAGEIVYQGKKFVGSAQTWIGPCVLQHGSLAIEPQIDCLAEIFAPDNESPESFRLELVKKVTSIREILREDVDHHEVAVAIKEGISEALRASFEPWNLSSEERALAEEIAQIADEQVPYHIQS
jgi:lipoyl(octanoyl) transferase